MGVAQEAGILRTIAAIPRIGWVAELVLHFPGACSHLLLVVASIVICSNLFVGGYARTV